MTTKISTIKVCVDGSFGEFNFPDLVDLLEFRKNLEKFDSVEYSSGYVFTLKDMPELKELINLFEESTTNSIKLVVRVNMEYDFELEAN